MPSIKAAVINSGQEIPYVMDVDYEPPSCPDYILVKVIAVSINHQSKERAMWQSNYWGSGGEGSASGCIAGVDGVGITTAGPVYFTTFVQNNGSFAEFVNVHMDCIYYIPQIRKVPITHAQVAKIAVFAHLARACHVALSKMMDNFEGKKPKILITGATGMAGQLAAKIAREIYKSGKIIGVGRYKKILRDLKKKDVINGMLSYYDTVENYKEVVSKIDVDVVLDFVGGGLGDNTLKQLLEVRKNPSKKLIYISAGDISGPNFSIPPRSLVNHNMVMMGGNFEQLDNETKRHTMSELIFEIMNDDILEFNLYEPEWLHINTITVEWINWDPRQRKVYYFEDKVRDILKFRLPDES